MIKFRKITIEGYGSIIQELKYKLRTPGLTIVQAKNGGGKSTIFSALFWCLYGKILKPNSSPIPWEDIRPKDFKGTLVTLEFNAKHKHYKLIRCKDYRGKVEGHAGKNRLILYVDGVQSKLRDKPDIQKEVVKVIGYSDALFKNSILFGQNLTRMIKQPNSDKKAIFDEAFEVMYLSEAMDKAQIDRRKITLSILELEPKSVSLLKDIHYTKKSIIEEKERIANYEKGKLVKINILTKKIKELEKSVSLQALDKLTDKFNGLESKITGEEAKLEEYKEILQSTRELILKTELTIENLGGKYEIALRNYTSIKEPSRVCPVCSGPINAETINDILKENNKARKLLKEEASGLKAKIKEEKDYLTRLKDPASINEYSTLIESSKNEIKLLQGNKGIAKNELFILGEKQKELRVLKNELEDLNAQDTCDMDLKKLRQELKNYRSLYKPIRGEIKTLKEQKELYDWAIKDPLSNSGIKAFIFKTMLHKVNEALRYYHKYLPYQIEFNIDLDSNKKEFYTLLYQNGFPRDYNDLSGGQQQVCDVCIAFAINDVLTLNKPCNILLMDEVFESLDADNIAVVNELIEDKAKKQSIHLVTHRQEFNYSHAHLISLELTPEGQTILS